MCVLISKGWIKTFIVYKYIFLEQDMIFIRIRILSYNFKNLN